MTLQEPRDVNNFAPYSVLKGKFHRIEIVRWNGVKKIEFKTVSADKL